MKQIIIIVSTILLGLAIYGLILGDKDSIKTGIKSFWQNEIHRQNVYP